MSQSQLTSAQLLMMSKTTIAEKNEDDLFTHLDQLWSIQTPSTKTKPGRAPILLGMWMQWCAEVDWIQGLKILLDPNNTPHFDIREQLREDEWNSLYHTASMSKNCLALLMSQANPQAQLRALRRAMDEDKIQACKNLYSLLTPQKQDVEYIALPWLATRLDNPHSLIEFMLAHQNPLQSLGLTFVPHMTQNPNEFQSNSVLEDLDDVVSESVVYSRADMLFSYVQPEHIQGHEVTYEQMKVLLSQSYVLPHAPLFKAKLDKEELLTQMPQVLTQPRSIKM